MIRIDKLSKSYGDRKALCEVSLEIPPGEAFAYLGPNGAGKTTTIRILTGLTEKTSGEAWIDNLHIEDQAWDAKKQCGTVPQHVNLDAELTVRQNLDIHGSLYHMPRAERNTAIDRVLAQVELTDRADSIVKTLSGGLKRRVLIARALVHSPKVLFMDEPTVGLDPSIRRTLWALIKTIQEEGTTIFLTTHYIEEAEFLADRVAFLNEGAVVALDRPQALMEQVGTWAVDRLDEGKLSSNYFPTEEAAREYMKTQEIGFTARRVNLEDAFLTLTGRTVE